MILCSRAPSVILPLLVVHLQAWLLKLGQILERNKICRSSEMCILLGHGRSRDPREREREREREEWEWEWGSQLTWSLISVE